jgi:hypothetical protein
MHWEDLELPTRALISINLLIAAILIALLAFLKSLVGIGFRRAPTQSQILGTLVVLYMLVNTFPEFFGASWAYSRCSRSASRASRTATRLVAPPGWTILGFVSATRLSHAMLPGSRVMALRLLLSRIGLWTALSGFGRLLRRVMVCHIHMMRGAAPCTRTLS